MVARGIKKYRKKPVIIEAIIYHTGDDTIDLEHF